MLINIQMQMSWVGRSTRLALSRFYSAMPCADMWKVLPTQNNTNSTCFVWSKLCQCFIAHIYNFEHGVCMSKGHGCAVICVVPALAWASWNFLGEWRPLFICKVLHIFSHFLETSSLTTCLIVAFNLFVAWVTFMSWALYYTITPYCKELLW